MVFSTSPEGQEVVQAPWKLVARVCINCLEKTKNDPAVHCQDVEVLGDTAEDDGSTNGTETEEHDFDWRSILGSESKGSRVLVVDLMDHLVKRSPVQSSV